MNSELKAIIEVLEQRKEPQLLFPQQTWNAALEQQIEALSNLGSSTEILTLIAALHLRNDSLDLSHSYAQQIEHDRTGAYWHGIMHRMEGDLSNASYWFRRASQHPVMEQVRERVASWLQQHESEPQGEHNHHSNNDHSHAPDRPHSKSSTAMLHAFKTEGWSSSLFIDQLRSASNLTQSKNNLLQSLQAIEIATLFQYTLDAANV